MKQSVNIAQLNELSEKGQKRLRKWWKPQPFDLFYNRIRLFDRRKPPESHVYVVDGLLFDVESTKHMRPQDVVVADLPILSIGQMIEFLDEHNKDKLTYALIDPDSENNWPVNELCDKLWEAVKEALEKK